MLLHIPALLVINLIGNFVSANYHTDFILNSISGYGYNAELHEVQTQDGYILGLHRIPHKNSFNTSRPVVLLMHGFLGAADNWIITGPKRSLAFLLFDKGYDVWMGNARGNLHSRKHVELNPDSDPKFWNFSWHEIGVFDLPAMIDYVLQTTGNKNLLYIGYSQGTTSFFVMASIKPEYNQKIELMIALAPIAYMSHVPNPTFQIVSFFKSLILRSSGTSFPIFELIPNNNVLNLVGEMACSMTSPLNELCASLAFLIFGYDSAQMDRSLIPLVLKSSPAGASIKQLYHFEQSIDSGEFQQFDYGRENMVMYGKEYPPKYNLDLVTTPIAMFYSKNDLLATVADVEHLIVNLPNVVTKHLIPYKLFNHMDFIFATDVVDLLYNNIFNVLDQYINHD